MWGTGLFSLDATGAYLLWHCYEVRSMYGRNLALGIYLPTLSLFNGCQ